MKTCGVCGADTWGFNVLKEHYRVGYVHLCDSCGAKANKFVNYFGVKKPADLAALHQFLIGGIKPMADFSALMNGGYYDDVR